MTSKRHRSAWLIAALPVLLAFAPSVPVSIQPASSITVKGTSTLHDFECSTKTIEGTIEMDPSGRSFASALVAVPVRTLHSSSASEDDNMYDALNAKKYPKILFSLINDSARTVQPGTADSVMNLHGYLTIAGKQRLIDLPAHVEKHANGTIGVRGTKKILMSEYGIDPPTFMLGVLKVGDEVTVEFSLELKEPGSQVQRSPAK